VDAALDIAEQDSLFSRHRRSRLFVAVFGDDSTAGRLHQLSMPATIHAILVYRRTSQLNRWTSQFYSFSSQLHCWSSQLNCRARDSSSSSYPATFLFIDWNTGA